MICNRCGYDSENNAPDTRVNIGFLTNDHHGTICDICADDLCEKCEANQWDLEGNSGTRYCTDCFSDNTDMAYEMVRDR